jgi:hypothetical protein
MPVPQHDREFEPLGPAARVVDGADTRLRAVLATRAAQQIARRACRADRLARLPRQGARPAPSAGAGPDQGDAEALETFLAALIGALDAGPARNAPAEVVPLDPRPARPDRDTGAAAGAAPAPDRGPVPGTLPAPGAAGTAGLARLPGAGPGLVAALVRAGVPDLAVLAGLDRDTLAARLGPLARLIDLDGWIVRAREEAAAPRP